MWWQIVFASRNAGKAVERGALLPGVELLGGLDGPVVEETGALDADAFTAVVDGLALATEE